jgi:hypothetical protein
MIFATPMATRYARAIAALLELQNADSRADTGAGSSMVRPSSPGKWRPWDAIERGDERWPWQDFCTTGLMLRCVPATDKGVFSIFCRYCLPELIEPFFNTVETSGLIEQRASRPARF